MDRTEDRLEQAMRVAGRAGHILLATVDETGGPRFTPVETCRTAGASRVAIQAWLDVPTPGGCGTGRLALLFWEEDGHGYQLIGRLARMEEAAVLDGLAEIEQQVRFPQVEKTVLMQVDSVEEFHFRPAEHSPRTEPLSSRRTRSSLDI